MRRVCMLIVFYAGLSCACDKVVKSERLQITEYRKEVRCNGRVGMCSYFNPVEGALEYGFSSSCDGHQTALIRNTPTHYTYESGAEDIIDSEQIIQREGVCK